MIGTLTRYELKKSVWNKFFLIIVHKNVGFFYGLRANCLDFPFRSI